MVKLWYNTNDIILKLTGLLPEFNKAIAKKGDKLNG